jgi:signal transduction histidine kinase
LDARGPHTKKPVSRPAAGDIEDRTAASEMEQCLERQNIAFDAIFGLLERLGTTQDVKKIVQLFLMTIMGQLGLKRACCYLVHPSRRTLQQFYALGVADAESLPHLPVKSSFVKWLRQLDKPEHFDLFFSSYVGGDRGEVDQLSPLVDEGFSYVYPLKDQDGMLGAVFYSAKVSGAGFSGFEAELLEMLAGVATITIKSAWLYQMTLLSKLELERFTEVKKEFINHTSHELRTPLTVLKSALWSIEPGEIEGDVMVDMAKNAVMSLSSVVEYLLSLNEIELKQTDLRMGLVDVSSIVEDCLREKLPEFEEKGITVRMQDNARYRQALIDPSKIKIVLRSLLDNALDFVEQGGTIEIETLVSDAVPGEGEGIEIGEWYLGLDQHFGGDLFDGLFAEAPESGNPAEEPPFEKSVAGGYYVVRVSDDGIGIPPEEIRTLAEPFKRATNSTHKNVKGLGIGLSVAQKIVAGHGGKLYCRSSEGQGSVFSIWLPMNT